MTGTFQDYVQKVFYYQGTLNFKYLFFAEVHVMGGGYSKQKLQMVVNNPTQCMSYSTVDTSLPAKKGEKKAASMYISLVMTIEKCVVALTLPFDMSFCIYY